VGAIQQYLRAGLLDEVSDDLGRGFGGPVVGSQSRPGLRALGRSTGSLLVIAGVWAGAVFTFLNGLTILACLPPCGGSFGIADIAHIGSLLSPFVAVFLTWQFVRHRAEPPVPARAQ